MARKYLQSLVRRVEDEALDNMLRNIDQRIAELVAVQLEVATLSGAESFSKAQVVALATLTPGTLVDVDGSRSNNYELLLGQNTTIRNPVNVKPGQIINIIITQNSTGAFTVAWGSAFKFPGGTPTVSAGANDVDLISGMVTAATEGAADTIQCSIAQDLT